MDGDGLYAAAAVLADACQQRIEQQATQTMFAFRVQVEGQQVAVDGFPVRVTSDIEEAGFVAVRAKLQIAQ